MLAQMREDMTCRERFQGDEACKRSESKIAKGHMLSLHLDQCELSGSGCQEAPRVGNRVNLMRVKLCECTALLRLFLPSSPARVLQSKDTLEP